VTPAGEDALLSAAASISDGGRIDWHQLGRAADDPRVIEQLQIIGRLAQVHASRTSWGALSIVEAIGNGTFGTVYRAFDNDLLREVALKVTRADALTVDPERLVREARLLARVRHPNVVTVYSAERKDDEVGVSMELIKGQTLDEIVKTQGPLSASEAAVIGVDVCRALAAVHAAGLLHGDIKAHNVMREGGGRVVLMDFGASRDLARSPLGDDFGGTPLYVAPEVFAGQPRGLASDIYSVGVLLYYLTTGTYPVEGDTRTAIMRQHEEHAPRRHLRDVRPDLPPGFIDVVERATDVDPAQRYPSAGALEAALAKSLGLRSAERRVSTSWVVIAAGIALIAVLAGTGAYWELKRTVRTNTATSVASGTDSAAPSGAAVAAAAAPYDVAAAMYRVDEAGSARPLAPDDRLAPGDRVYLQVRTSVPANVYVVNEDDRGESYLLFPLPNQASGNPLPAGREHRLPGIVAGREMYWQVTSAGGHEHFVIFVSPEPLTAFEETFASLPRPTTGEPVLSARLSERAIGVLRGVGGLVPAPNQTVPTSATLSAQYSTPLPSRTETTRGPWVRQVTFENP
jgi:serine/threonine protein kinase